MSSRHERTLVYIFLALFVIFAVAFLVSAIWFWSTR